LSCGTGYPYHAPRVYVFTLKHLKKIGILSLKITGNGINIILKQILKHLKARNNITMEQFKEL
jgi:hypothetical protein